MKLPAGAALLGALACQAAPATPRGSDVLAIVDGELSEKGAHPETVFIWHGGSACTGTLIASNLVLTARHCVEGTDHGELSLYFGNDPDGGGGQWLEVENHVYHPSGDIALIRTAQEAPTAPVPFRRQSLWSQHVGRDVQIVGFGDTGELSGAGLKREGATTVADVSEELLWVGTTGSKTCFGDSGGPTFMTTGGQKFVIGVSSFVTSANCKLGVSGSIRTDRYRQWIEEYAAEFAAPTCAVDAQCDTECDVVDPDCPCSSTDGACTAMCEDYLTEDLDCAGCGADGQCRDDCPQLDPDCCDLDSICNAACAEPDPDCSLLGDTCTSRDDCSTGRCEQHDGISLCVDACDGDSSCPSGFQCIAGADGGACWPEAGGCALSTGRSSRHRDALLLLAWIGLLWRRRAKKR